MILGILDVETTGLDPQKDQLLELAILVYRKGEKDVNQEPLPDGLVYVDHTVFTYTKKKDGVDPVVVEMHKKNGLWDECFNSSVMCDEADAYIAKNLPDKMVLCGRNVHLDSSFLKQHLPEVSKKFTHRHLDLTTIDYLRGRTPRPPSTHRALHDAMAELLELTMRPAMGRSVLEELA